MKITNKTVLITGGGSGIGLAIAKQLIEKNNRVVIIGRTESKLKQAAVKLVEISYVVGDINSPEDSAKLKEYLQENFAGIYQMSRATTYNYAFKKVNTKTKTVLYLLFFALILLC